MKLITCTCLFVTLLSLSDAFMENFAWNLQQSIAAQNAAMRAQIQRNIDNMNRQTQSQIQQQIMDATGGSASSVQGFMSNSQQSTSCTNGRCVICNGNSCKVCERGTCVPCNGNSCFSIVIG